MRLVGSSWNLSDINTEGAVFILTLSNGQESTFTLHSEKQMDKQVQTLLNTHLTQVYCNKQSVGPCPNKERSQDFQKCFSKSEKYKYIKKSRYDVCQVWQECLYSDAHSTSSTELIIIIITIIIIIIPLKVPAVSS